MNAGLYVVIALFILVLVTLAKGVRLVPQGYKWVVQRLGKYHSTLGPGLNIIIPYVDSVAYKVTTKDIVLDIPSQEVITKDNAVIIANAVAYINILSPEKAVYGVEDYRVAIQTLVQTTLRSIVGEMDLDDALSSRDQIKAHLKNAISDDISDWGITLKTVEIQDINPSVLVTYPNTGELDELARLHEIISGNRSATLISNLENFLIIFGYKSPYRWEGFVYKSESWKAI